MSVGNFLTLAAQLISSMVDRQDKEKKKNDAYKDAIHGLEESKQDARGEIYAQRAASLGAPMYGVNAARFNRDNDRRREQIDLAMRRHEEPPPLYGAEQLVKMYGAFGDDSKDPNDTSDVAGHNGEWRYPEMDDEDWKNAEQSRGEAISATSNPDFVGLYPEDDPEFRRRHGG